jgi:hypothetical protein
MIEVLRLVQERITAASPPDEVVTETARVLEKLAATLGPYEVRRAQARPALAGEPALPGS